MDKSLLPMQHFRLTPAIAGLPVGRRYRVPIRERFEVAGIQIERRLDPGGTSAAVMVGGAGGALLEAVRRAGRWGAGTGGWVFLCPRCGASVRALEHADDGWGCDHCPDRRPLQGRLFRLERRAERVSRPRRLGEPRWRWERRSGSPGAGDEDVIAAMLEAVAGRPPEKPS